MAVSFARRVNALLLGTGVFVGHLGATFLTLARIVGTGAHRYVPGNTAKGGTALILCSGPSLKASLSELRQLRRDAVSFVSVNDFYKNESFFELRPALHVIADPVYWEDLSFDEFAAPLARALGGLDWQLRLCLPYAARGTRLHNELDRCGISYGFFPATSVTSFDFMEALVFRAGLGMPTVQNVLVAALAISIWEGHRKIGVVGADHSWHEEIVMASDNILRVRTSHSYAISSNDVPFAKPSSMWKLRQKLNLERDDVFSIKEIFLAWARVHWSYESLARLSRPLQVTILNCSARSFIDAFQRSSLEEFLKAARSAVPNLQAD